MLMIVQAVSDQSTTKFWETWTVVFTITSAIFGCFGVVFSLWEDKRRFFRISDRTCSVIGAVVALMAGYSLLQYTHYNRIDEAAMSQELTHLAVQANIAVGIAHGAVGGLNIEEGKLSQTKQELATTSAKAASAIAQLNSSLAESNRMTGLQVLITKMNADDAEAFDELRSMKHFDTPEQEKMVKEAIQSVIDLHNVRGYVGASGYFFKYAPEPDEAIQMLSLKDTTTRKSALRCLLDREYVPNAGPILFHLATTDPSLDARTLATQIINKWGNDYFTALEPEQLQRWWYVKGGGKDQFP
jgi:hypothetical protein